MNKIIRIVIFLLIGFGTLAQDYIDKKSYKPVATKSFGIEDGLLWNCVLTADMDSSGLLNIIPCIHVQIAQGLHFFKFDGFQSYGLNPPQIIDKRNAVIIPFGYKENGNLYGILADKREDPNYTEYVEYNQNHWETNFVISNSGDTLLIYNGRVQDNNEYYLGTLNRKTIVLERSNQEEKIYTLAPEIEETGPSHTRSPLLITKDYIWTKNWKNIVRRVSRRTGEIKPYYLPESDVFSPIVPDKIFEGPDHRIFATIHAKGKVYEYDEEIDEFILFSPDIISNKATINSYCYQDGLGQLLFITQIEGGALFSYLLRENKIMDDYSEVSNFFPANPFSGLRNVEIYSKDFENELFVLGSDFLAIEVQSNESIEAISASDARGFFYAEEDKLLISAAGLYDLKSKVLSNPNGKYCTNLDLKGESDMVTLPNGTIIRGMLNAQLSVYHPSKGSCDVFNLPGEISRMCLEDDEFLIAVVDNKLGRLDLEEFKWSPILTAEIPGFINALKVLKDGTIAIASSAGFYILPLGQKELQNIYIGGNQDEQQILSIFEKESGDIMLGTFRQGLIVWNRDLNNFHQLNQSHGLSNNTVASIVKDKDGDFWLGTFNGIGIIDSTYQLLGHVFELDGLIDNECNRWSSGILKDGRLFFGTPEGFSLIDADLVKEAIENKPNPTIYLTQVEFDNQLIILEFSELNVNGKPTIILPANNRNLNFSFGLSSYASVDQNTFEYKIDKDGYQWNFVGSVNDLIINNLPPGQYNILIRGTDYKGRQSSNILTIPILVSQYFYKTWWFVFLMGLLILTLIATWFLRLRNEKRRLELEVNKRTQTIKQQAEDLKKLDKAKTRLFTNISHEFRTPLTVILGLANKSDQDKRAPEMIKRNAKNLLNLVNQILDLRKLESGKMTLSLIQSDVNRYLSYISESMKSLAESNGLQYHYLAPQNAIIIDFDPDKLTKIVVNLISNAVKFTPEGGHLYIQLEHFELPVKHIKIKVRDTGIGILKEDQERIFHRFFQLETDENIRSRFEFEGTGIGLTFAKSLVELMKGSIEVESTIGKGSTFIVTLPIHNNAPFSESGLTENEMIQPFLFSEPPINLSTTKEIKDAPTLLVVDDNPDILHYVQSCLQSTYNILLARHGNEGIEKAIERVPDLIISDVMMPMKDGLELCETLKTDDRTSHIPIILLTAKADIESKLEGLSRGADAYLAKPFNERELLLNIEKMITLRENLRKRYSSENWIEKQSQEPDLRLEDGFLLRFRNTLLENLANEEWGVSDMTTAMLVSRTQLHNKIKALTGKSVSQFIRTIRLQEALKILRLKEKNISQVAYEVGFKDPKYFSRVFKDEFGETPSEWVIK